MDSVVCSSHGVMPRRIVLQHDARVNIGQAYPCLLESITPNRKSRQLRLQAQHRRISHL